MPRTHGYAALSARSPLAPFAFDRRDPRPHDVAIDIKYCGICHSDIHQVRNEWTGDSIYPMVPGHEIAGVVTGVGTDVTRFTIGDPVGVGCFVDTCRVCVSCQAGLEQYCVAPPTFTYNGIERDGVTPTMGGYSNAIVVDENYVLRMPPSLPLDAAAPLLCAGITLYSPLRHWKTGPGTRVGIIGLGGLGHMGVKIARALGAEVTVFSRSRRKHDDAMRLGAHHFHVTSRPDALATLERTFDLIINTASAAVDWSQYLKMLRVDGSMVVVGIPETPVSLAAQPLIQGRRSLAGS
ncbi:MAG TPA: NAD(P)-dependent alcohol dehydrogenase, partial [Vicinamibacterales bacterium]